MSEDGNIMKNPDAFREREGRTVQLVNNDETRRFAVQVATSLQPVTVEQLLSNAEKIANFVTNGTTEPWPVLVVPLDPAPTSPDTPGAPGTTQTR